MTFGEKIKTLRKEKNWSQNDLGKLVKMHPRYISKYEMDQVKPTSDAIVKIASAFKVSADYLLFDDETAIKPSAYIKNTKLLELFEELEKMRDKDQETIISLIEAYIAKNKK